MILDISKERTLWVMLILCQILFQLKIFLDLILFGKSIQYILFRVVTLYTPI